MRLFSSQRTTKPPTALIAWEIGAGFTHSQNLWGVVRHLRHMGWRCVIATADPRFETWFRALGADVVQTYLWPAMRSGVMLPEPRPNRVLTDIFANYAISRPTDLKAAIAHYDTLLALVKPDIVLCENAFGAMLAARGRTPVIAYGSTLLFMPPILGDAFAPIDPTEPDPSWPIEGVLDDINAALGASGRIPLTRPADIFDCHAVIPFGPAAFDPYPGFRTEKIYAPHCPDLPATMAAHPGSDTVVYLHDVTQMATDVMTAIEALKASVRIYIPSLAPELRQRFEARGHRIETRMMPLSQLAETAGLLIHQGGVTLTAAALALGIPQVILARFHENGLAGRFVVAETLGFAKRLDQVQPDWIVATIETARRDRALQERCRSRAAEFRSWFDGDPTAVVATEAAKALGHAPQLAPPVAGQHAWSPI